VVVIWEAYINHSRLLDAETKGTILLSRNKAEIIKLTRYEMYYLAFETTKSEIISAIIPQLFLEWGPVRMRKGKQFLEEYKKKEKIL
jgi:hypothetical protein